MLKFNFSNNKELKILCLGAHSDDIELGCGGTILRLLKEIEKVEVQWVVFSAHSKRAEEANKSANLFLTNAQEKNVVIKNFRERFFPYIGSEIKEYFDELKLNINPDIIFTHYLEDRHQDHRLISELTWNTFRNHFILEYEIPKYEGDLGKPNFFVELAIEMCQEKSDAIFKCFKSQHDKIWFDQSAFLSILRLRGIEANASSMHAEGFYSRKIIF